jgi:hypothetical protein
MCLVEHAPYYLDYANQQAAAAAWANSDPQHSVANPLVDQQASQYYAQLPAIQMAHGSGQTNQTHYPILPPAAFFSTNEPHMEGNSHIQPSSNFNFISEVAQTLLSNH